MKIVYSCEAIPTEINKSIFLAGPSLRAGQENLISWRIKALQILSTLEYDGVVFVPESKTGNWDNLPYDKVNDWETRCLTMADNILFYINRNVEEGILGLTTNQEFGYWIKSGKCVLGTEPNADSVRYQETWAKKLNVPLYHELYNSIKYIIDLQKNGSLRTNGERWIPLSIWNLSQFQDWYNNVKISGNILEEAKVEDVFLLPNGKVFSFRLWANIYITKEKRHKNNEFMFSRPDISSCVLYYPRPDMNQTEVVLVKEFRTPVNNELGYVYELPGGSSFKPNEDIKEIVINEIHEETGFKLDISKLEFESSRQIYATLLTHKCHLFSYELSSYELDQIKKNAYKTFGNIEDTELTYIEIKKVHQLLSESLVDWNNLGLILSVLNKKELN